MTKIIALYSPAPQSGKSTLAGIMGKMFNWTYKASFARPLKNMARSFLGFALPMDADVNEYIKGSLKESPIPELNGITARHIMQTLGTEWGRNCLYENVWVDLMKCDIRSLVEANPEVGMVVIDDMRFENEYKAMRDMGACLVRITRPGYTKQHDHPSDGALDDYDFDIELVNDGTPEEMYEQFRVMYEAWEEMQ